MEGQTESLVSLISTLVVEEVVLEIIAHSEQSAASCVRSCVDTIRAGNTPREGTWSKTNQIVELDGELVFATYHWRRSPRVRGLR